MVNIVEGEAQSCETHLPFVRGKDKGAMELLVVAKPSCKHVRTQNIPLILRELEEYLKVNRQLNKTMMKIAAMMMMKATGLFRTFIFIIFISFLKQI
jgi:hypothetical protein